MRIQNKHHTRKYPPIEGYFPSHTQDKHTPKQRLSQRDPEEPVKTINRLPFLILASNGLA
jgi:hypothetical protein